MDDRPTPPDDPELLPEPPAEPGLFPEAPAPAEPRRRRRGLVVGSVVAAAVVLVAGGAAAFFSMRGSSEELLTRLPADTQLAITAYLDPSAGQKANLFRLTEKFPALGSREELTKAFDRMRDSMLPESGLARDDLDWIGVEVAVAGKIGLDGVPTGGILIDADDEDAAQAALEKAWNATGDGTSRTVDYGGSVITVGSDVPGEPEIAWTVVDGVVVVGFGEEFVHGVIDTVNGKPALADDAAFLETVGPLPAGRLGLLYMDPAGAVEALGPELAPAGQPTGFEGTLGYGMTLSAEPDGLAFDVNVATDPSKLAPAQREALGEPDHDNPLLEGVPAAAYGLVTTEHVDVSVKTLLETVRSAAPEAIDELERAGVIGDGSLLEALTGDLAFEVSPGDAPAAGGVLMLGTDDEAQMRRGLDKLADMALEGLLGLGEVGVAPFPLPPGALSSSEFTTLSLADTEPPGVFREFDPRWRKQSHGGVEIRVLDAGMFAPPISYAVADGVAMIASSPDQIALAIDTLRGDEPSITSDDGFNRAIGRVPSSDGLIYANVERIVAAVRDGMSPMDKALFDGLVAANLEPIRAVVAGSTSDEHRQTARLVILIF